MRTILRRVLGLPAPLLLVLGAAGAAAADVMPRTGNEDAWVHGVAQCDIDSPQDCWTWIDPVHGTPCPAGHFCLYTARRAYEGGKVFSFYHCADNGKDWALHGWRGVGYYHNSDTGGAHGYLKEANHRVILNAAPGTSGIYDFTSTWFLRAC
ncbi:MAG: hypothetical protein HOW97_36165 [Catenulispora sp.]|nr:hypothetical protein [Catenulispora sp.]